MKICIIGVLPSSLLNFRGELIKSFVANNHQVISMGADVTTIEVDNIENLGIKYIDYPVQRNGLNPLADVKTLLSFVKVFKEESPDLVLSYTIKPVIWGGITTILFPNIQFYALITGLGFAFQKGDFIRNRLLDLVSFLYRTALKNSEKVIFQNSDNMNLFISKGIVAKGKCTLVNGSGVDIEKYSYAPLPEIQQITFLTIGRLLGEKGFREYAQAATLVKKQYPDAVFQLLGPEDPSPDGLSMEEVYSWQQSGSINYLNPTDNVRPYIESCHVYVLPSYHEGLPRTVLEAMAIGRPILTTDVPGCRETVINGENGYLVPKADANALAERMIWFIENQGQWERMSKRSRQLAEEKYDVHKVNAQLMEIMGL